MPDFKTVHHVKRDAQGRVISTRVDPHLHFVGINFSAVLYHGNVWSPEGDSLSPPESWPDEFVQFLENLTPANKARLGFTDGEPEETEEDEGPAPDLTELVEEHLENEDAYDANDRLSLAFFSGLMGRRVKRAELNAILEAREEDEDEDEDEDD